MTDSTWARIDRARSIAHMFQRAHVYAMQRAVPERIVVRGDDVQTTWAPWMDAQMRDAERVGNAWMAIVASVASFDDDAVLGSLRAFDELLQSIVPPVVPE